MEKTAVEEIDERRDVALDEKPTLGGFTLAPETSRRIRKAIDFNLLPLLTFTYSLQFLDKVSLGNAAIMGVIPDNNLKGQDYSWCSSLFYFGFLAFSYPASVIMVRLPLGKYLAGTIVIWGIVLGLHAVSSSFASLATLRTLLGVTEASVMPGFTLIMGIWYTREEQPFRQGLWYVGNSCAGLAGGLLAYAISHIHGPLHPWRYLFIIYGCATLLWGLVLLLILPDTPLNARFLTQEQREDAVRRVQTNGDGVKDGKWKKEQALEALLDPQSWLLSLFMLSISVPSGGLTNFQTIIIQGFGFPQFRSLLLQLPGSAETLVLVPLAGYLASKIPQARCYICIGLVALTLVGEILVYSLPETNKAGRLIGIYLWPSFSAAYPLVMSFISSNVGGITKKSVVGSMVFISYCVGNIIGPQMFLSTQSPRYQTGFIGCVAFSVIAILAMIILRLFYMFANRKKSSAWETSTGSSVTDSLDQILEATRLGALDYTDKANVAFTYLL